MDRVTILKQEIFNEVFLGAAAQGFRPSYFDDEAGTCAYRGRGASEGLKCNVGILIPDDRYDSDIEGSDLSHAPIFGMTTAYDRAIAGNFDIEDMDEIKYFLCDLQNAHDVCGAHGNPAAAHRNKLVEMAAQECLTVPALAEAA